VVSEVEPSAIDNPTEQTNDISPLLRKGKEAKKADQDKNGKRLSSISVQKGKGI
jgi:hypothetical protein